MVVLPLSLLLIYLQAIISFHPSSCCDLKTLRAFFLFGGIFSAGVTLHKCRNVPGVETILRQQGNTGRNRSMWEHVFPLVFPEPVPGTLWGKPIAVSFLSPLGKNS